MNDLLVCIWLSTSTFVFAQKALDTNLFINLTEILVISTEMNKLIFSTIVNKYSYSN